MSRNILVIGGGFAGFWAAIAARRVAKSAADITVVSREPRLEIRPRLYEARPDTLAVDVLPYLDKVDVNFVRGEAAGLDTTGKIVSLDDGTRLTYDRLIVATGSRICRPPVPGAAEAYSVDTQTEAITFDRRLKELASDTREPTIAVVGAGFTGIELSLELRDRLVAHGAAEAAERLRIVLIDRSNVVGPELGPGPRSEIERALQSARIELRLDATITGLASNLVRFADGSVLSADAVVLATGMRASSFAAKVPGERDELGRVIVDAELRAPAAPGVFVAGDAAAADTGDGHRALQSCQHALQIGRVAGENAARDLLGMPAVPYSQLNYVTCLDLGRWGAVRTQGWDRRVELTGAEGKALKRKINTKLIYPPADGGAEALLASSTIDIVKRYAIDGSR
ncbi:MULTISPECIES: NAD(P)/FAD-dependent oxidoreductase [Bradyrhizobium]|uniref:NAD(P)/FAD-dependent oxidoreductase n=1 Tax=Bradyrhizobium TaxID=374 RepID=UPI001EDC45FF|nr:FAD-dependent oxidoreductase [Bradyrhizobium zhengyangense]MCG2641395.1 FAD-dependent oxidoreductase [Bradyrhizobium zhengyangense]